MASWWLAKSARNISLSLAITWSSASMLITVGGASALCVIARAASRHNGAVDLRHLRRAILGSLVAAGCEAPCALELEAGVPWMDEALLAEAAAAVEAEETWTGRFHICDPLPERASMCLRAEHLIDEDDGSPESSLRGLIEHRAGEVETDYVIRELALTAGPAPLCDQLCCYVLEGRFETPEDDDHSGDGRPLVVDRRPRVAPPTPGAFGPPAAIALPPAPAHPAGGCPRGQAGCRLRASRLRHGRRSEVG